MKARLVPVYFKSEKEEEFSDQLTRLKELLADEADLLIMKRQNEVQYEF